MQSNSRVIVSNQDDIHPDLSSTVLKHQSSIFLQPYKPFSEEIFSHVDSLRRKSSFPLILDSGCGNGTSTFNLAQKYPDHLVIGIDKSEFRLHARLQQNSYYQHKNIILVRAELVDFWRLALAANWQPKKHYLLYPNPWPKKKHLQRRWHGHAIFPTILKLGGILECRSNWSIYIQELAEALRIIGYESSTRQLEISEYLTPFEKKYHLSNHTLLQLKTDLEP